VLGASGFRLEPYAEAARTWLHAGAEVIDAMHLWPDQVAERIVEGVDAGR